MAIVYLPFVLLFFVIFISPIAIFVAFILKSKGKFSYKAMSFVIGLISFLLKYCFFIYSLSGFTSYNLGGVAHVTDHQITMLGYLAALILASIFAILGAVIGSAWCFILNKISKQSGVKT